MQILNPILDLAGVIRRILPDRWCLTERKAFGSAMRLPPREVLTHPDHLFLYAHDSRELFNPNTGDFGRLMYVTRFHLVLETVGHFSLGKRVLDVGCAQGNFSLALAQRGYQVVAMDLRPTFLQYLRLKLGKGELNCVAANLEFFPFRHGVFDVVVLGEVIEHVAYPEKLLSDIAELLAPNGILVVTTPNGDRIHTALPNLSMIRNRQALVARQFAPDGGGHLFLLRKVELLKLADDTGLTVRTHQFFCTPWVTGGLKFRSLTGRLPVTWRVGLDRLFLRCAFLRQRLCEGQLLVASRIVDI